jgi:hypothetical protein
MFLITTPRLILITTPLNILEMRMKRDDFVADVPVHDTIMRVTFPPEWPGDALVLFPSKIAQWRKNADDVG